MGKVTVWKCEEHGEYEILKEMEVAHCPECGKPMEKVGEYEE